MAETASDILSRLRLANVQRQNMLGQQATLPQNRMALTPGLNKAIRFSNLNPSQKNDQDFMNILPQVTSGIDARNIDATATARLQATLDRQRANLANTHQIDAEPPEADIGIIPRIFDIISRGQYSVMEGLRAGQEAVEEGDNNPFNDLFQGMKEGFSGRAKTSFSDVLTEAQEQTGIDLPRGVTGGLGFAGNVLGDPLTYTGVGIIKKGGALAADKAAAKAIKEGQKKLTSKVVRNAAEREVRAAGRRAVDDLLEAAEKKGIVADEASVKLVKSKAMSEARQELNKRTTEQLLAAAKEAADTAMINEAGKVQLKLLGRPVMESEKLYKMAGTVTKPLTDKQLFQNVNTFFRPQATFPGFVNELKRTKEGAGVARWSVEAEDFRKFVRGEKDPAMGKLSAEDGIRLTHGLEAGDNFLGEVGTEGANLEKWARYLRKTFDDLYDDEVTRGIFDKPDAYLDNYVPHYFIGGDKNAINKWKNARRNVIGTETPGFTKQRVMTGSLAEAKDRGLKPIEDIREIFLERLKKHHNVVARQEFVSELASTYGVRISGKGSKVAKDVSNRFGLEKLDSKFAPGDVYVPEQIAKVVRSLENIQTNDELAKEFTRMFDEVQNTWKILATVVNPGHHLRNLLGDVFLNFEDGVVNPLRYGQSAAVIARTRGGKFAEALQRGLKTKGERIKIGNTYFTPGEIMGEYRETGLKAGWYQTEFGRPTDILSPAGKIGEAVGGAERGLRHASEIREEFTRLAHFIDALAKEGKGINAGKNRILDFKKAAEKAAARVRKWNIDYGDFTPHEMKYMKRAYPFYSFMRKNMPLQLEALFLRPGRVAAIPKINSAIETLLGTDEREPWEQDRIPQWIQDLSAIRIMGGNEPAFLTVGTPFHDIARLEGIKDIFLDGDVMQGGGEVLREMLSMTTPIAKMPAEMAFGRSAFTGAPLRSGSSFAAGSVPLTRVMYQIATAEDPRDAAKTLANWVANLGFQQATYPRQSGELRRQQDVVEELLRGARESVGMGQ